ncbi:MAG: hypothetical protein RL497_1644 [Pseudomonadota bacterium]|jgi:alpha-glucosidase (family GH31 glycosyl hydrolase)
MILTRITLFIITLSASLGSQASDISLRSGNAELKIHNQHIIVQQGSKTLIDLESIKFNYESVPNWTVHSANNDEIILHAQLPAEVDYYRKPTDNTAKNVALIISRRENGFRLYAAPTWGRQVTLNLRYLGDHFFGLSAPLQPDNRLSADLTGTHINVEVQSEEANLRENYASAFSAFYMSSFGYGAFFDTFAKGTYEFAINGQNQIHHQTGTLDWTIFTGETGAAIHQAYYSLIGAPKKIPMWALGPVGWRDQNNGGAAEIISDIKHLSDLKIPFTAWFVDRPYSEGNHAWSKMNFSPAFAEPQKWIGKIRSDFGLEFMTWVTPATFGDTRFAKHLAGKFTYLDLSHAATTQAYQQALTQLHYTVGVKGHKIDRADEGFPVAEEWADATPVFERKNKYSYLMAKAQDEALRKSWGNDQFTFTRAAIHRTQPYTSAIWGGDPRTSWQGLQANFANAMRSSFMGFPIWGTDVGGYQGDGFIPEDLYLRWLQAGSMTGLFEIKLDGAGGSGQDRMPWRYSPQFQAQFRAILAERMQLLPYIYSLANTSAVQGTLMQPLAYRHLNDKNTYSIWDEFYLGAALLVAPVFNEQLTRSVYLPEGTWRNFNPPFNFIQGGKKIDVQAPLDVLPRFLRENSIYVRGDIYRGNDKLWENTAKTLTIHAFPASKKGSAHFTYIDFLDGNKEKIIRLNNTGKTTHSTAQPLAQGNLLN